MAVNIHITIIELNALHTKRQNLFQELDAVIHLLMEAKHWGLRKSRNATSRSEERFSRNAETDLVCRLLLEKKKHVIEAANSENALLEFVRRNHVSMIVLAAAHTAQLGLEWCRSV